MSVRSILFVYHGEDYEASALDEACRLAIHTRAEVRVLYVIAPLTWYPDLYEGDVVQLEKEGLARAEKAQAAAEKCAAAHELPFTREWFSDPQPVMPRMVFQAVTGDLRGEIRKFGRASDIVVAGRGAPDAVVNLDHVLAGLLEAGTPVLVIPSAAGPWFGKSDSVKSVVLAWDGSLQAGRAMRALEGLVAPGRAVQIMCILHGNGLRGPCDPSVARSWLELHGFAAHISRSGPFVTQTGEAVLKGAGQLGAGLLVMGAYGHSHWSQVIWGGVTSHVLKHAGLPVLLHH